jgi:hypothetical protein
LYVPLPLASEGACCDCVGVVTCSPPASSASSVVTVGLGTDAVVVAVAAVLVLEAELLSDVGSAEESHSEDSRVDYCKLSAARVILLCNMNMLYVWCLPIVTSRRCRLDEPPSGARVLVLRRRLRAASTAASKI